MSGPILKVSCPDAVGVGKAPEPLKIVRRRSPEPVTGPGVCKVTPGDSYSVGHLINKGCGGTPYSLFGSKLRSKIDNFCTVTISS